MDNELHQNPSWKQIAAMLLLSVTSLLIALDSTIFVTALPVGRNAVSSAALTSNQVIARELGASATESFWIGTSYLLTSAVLQPVFSALAEYLNPWKLIWFSVLLFGMSSLLYRLANSSALLLCGQSL